MQTSRGQKLFFKMNIIIFIIRVASKIILNSLVTSDNTLITVLYSQFLNLSVLGRPDIIFFFSFIQNMVYIIKYALQITDEPDTIHIYVGFCIGVYCLSSMLYTYFLKYRVFKINYFSFF